MSQKDSESTKTLKPGPNGNLGHKFSANEVRGLSAEICWERYPFESQIECSESVGVSRSQWRSLSMQTLSAEHIKYGDKYIQIITGFV